MLRSDEERSAKPSIAAPAPFGPLTADPKGASADRQVASSSFALDGNRPVLPASSLAIDGAALILPLPTSPAPGEPGESKGVDSEGASVPPEPPRTKLGRELYAIRRRIVESGIQLFDWDEIEAEVAARRGERA